MAAIAGCSNGGGQNAALNNSIAVPFAQPTPPPNFDNLMSSTWGVIMVAPDTGTLLSGEWAFNGAGTVTSAAMTQAVAGELPESGTGSGAYNVSNNAQTLSGNVSLSFPSGNLAVDLAGAINNPTIFSNTFDTQIPPGQPDFAGGTASLNGGAVHALTVACLPDANASTDSVNASFEVFGENIGPGDFGAPSTQAGLLSMGNGTISSGLVTGNLMGTYTITNGVVAGTATFGNSTDTISGFVALDGTIELAISGTEDAMVLVAVPLPSIPSANVSSSYAFFSDLTFPPSVMSGQLNLGLETTPAPLPPCSAPCTPPNFGGFPVNPSTIAVVDSPATDNTTLANGSWITDSDANVQLTGTLGFSATLPISLTSGSGGGAATSDTLFPNGAFDADFTYGIGFMLDNFQTFGQGGGLTIVIETGEQP
jgi:hypothetical protein